ncbi:MAG: hypothetical protein B6241_04675 [Spirochaetaceae bacterium 4572_59]|nr:MAG: hypothetical protein B6241_04675 [Spirochaetaceae bacterium 4572_59]
MRTYCVALLILICHSLPVVAFQWPSDPDRIIKSFCEVEDQKIYRGLQFSQPELIRPFDAGDVVFRYIQDPFSPLPGGGSSLLVLQHENGFQSVYEGLSDETVKTVPSRVTQDMMIDANPDLEEYRFCIRDARLTRLVNPLLILPGLNDRIPPELLSLHLLAEDGTLFPVVQRMVIPAGGYDVYIHVIDKVAKKNPLVLLPYMVSLYNLGSLQAERKLDTLIQRDNHLSLQDGISLKNIYDKDGNIFLGSIILNSGSASMEVAMEDFYGNKESRQFNFSVVR